MRGIIFVLSLLSFYGIFAQTTGQKVFFDKAERSCSEGSAYYYRVKADEGNNYKSYYINGNALYFEGQIISVHASDEDKNKYTGTCKWYYKNGKTKATRTFAADGLENGTSSYFYENGKLSKEVEYVNGKIKGNRYKSFDEDGSYSMVFEDQFQDNSNDWDIYTSDKSHSVIKGGELTLLSFTNEGASRYISIPIEGKDYLINGIMNTEKLKVGEKAGIIFGYKDWQNYNYFMITQTSFYVGSVYEGIIQKVADGMYCNSIVKNGVNDLKLLTNGNKVVFTINGEIQFSSDAIRLYGSNVGFVVTGKSSVTVDKLLVKEFLTGGGSPTANTSDIDVKATGSGLVFSSNGYIITNHHVVENASKVIIDVNSSGTNKTYTAKVVLNDKDNDLAIVKIDDPSFTSFGAIPFPFKESGVIEVGASVFTLGYPHALSGMGKEVKFTDGKISSKTGYNNAINSFQSSIPIQPGNSGGPVFNDKGELLGLINASVHNSDNVSYAIKLNYIKNLIELLNEPVAIPVTNSIADKKLEEKIKVLSDFVVLIKIK